MGANKRLVVEHCYVHRTKGKVRLRARFIVTEIKRGLALSLALKIALGRAASTFTTKHQVGQMKSRHTWFLDRRWDDAQLNRTAFVVDPGVTTREAAWEVVLSKVRTNPAI